MKAEQTIKHKLSRKAVLSPINCKKNRRRNVFRFPFPDGSLFTDNRNFISSLFEVVPPHGMCNICSEKRSVNCRSYILLTGNKYRVVI